MIYKSTLLWIALSILAVCNGNGQTLISEETFDEGDGAMSGTMSDGSAWAVTAVNDCDGSGGIFQVESGAFEITDMEGFNCCECFPGGGGTGCGDAGNTLVFGPIDISGFFGIEVDFDFSQSGNMECYTQFEDPPMDCPATAQVACQGGNDQVLFSFRVDGGAWTNFAYYCGDQFCLGQDFTCGVDNGSQLEIRIQGGTQSPSESYFIDNMTVSGFSQPLAVATANGQDNSAGAVTLCEGGDINLDETAGQATSWQWTGPDGFSSTLQNPTIANATSDASGTYFVEIVDANGCPETDTIDVQVVAASTIDPISDVTACNFYVLPPIQGSGLSGNEAYFDQSGGNGTQYAEGDTIFADGTYYAYDDNMGCSAEESFSVTISTVVANSTTLSTCDEGGGQATFDLTSVNNIVNNGTGNTVTWYSDPATNNPIADPTMYTSMSGPVFATVSDGSCTSEPVFVSLNVVDSELGDFGVFCNNQMVTNCILCDDDYPTDPGFTLNLFLSDYQPYLYIFEISDDSAGVYMDTIVNPTGPFPITVFGDATVNLIEVVDTASGCSDITGHGSLTLDYIRAPEIDPISDTTVCNTFVFPPIEGDYLTGNEAYYDFPFGQNIQYNPGDETNLSGTYYAFDGTLECFDEQAFVVTVEFSGGDPTFDYPDFCAGDIGAPTNVTTPGGTWSFAPDPGGPTTIDPNTGEITNGVANWTYAVEYQLGTGVCATRDTQLVTVFDLPSLTFIFLGCDPDNPGFYKATVTTPDSVYATVGDVLQVGVDTFDLINIPSGAQYDVIWVDPATGCDAMITQVADVCSNCPPDPPVSPGDTSVCPNDPIPTLTVTADPGLEIDWYDAETGGNLLQDNSASYTPAEVGTFWVETFDPVEMCSSTRIPITITLLPNPSFSISAPECNANGTWYINTSFDDTQVSVSADTGMIIDNMDGTFTIDSIPQSILSVVVTFTQISSGCQTSVTSLLNDPCPCNLDPPVSGGDTTVCDPVGNPTLTVSVPPGIEVDWYDAETGGNLLLDNSTEFIPPDPGTYWAEALDGSCSSVRTPITYTVVNLPTFNPLDTVCDPDNGTYAFSFESDAALITIDNGVIVNNGNGTYDIIDIPENTDVNITLSTTLAGCEETVLLEAPNCACPDVLPPASDGDQSTCVGDPAPILSVTPPGGLIVDWYDAPDGGNLILEDSETLIPAQPGTYYAESRDATGCTSGSRAAVSWIVNDLPTYALLDTTCDADLLFYTATISTNGNNVSASDGMPIDNGDGSWSISDIPADQDITLLISNSGTGCDTSVIIPAPNCSCPEINAPVSGGDQEICENDPFIPLNASADQGLVIDWYDAAVDGNLLLEDSDDFVPVNAGTFYAEARDPATGCLSNTRTPITLTVNDLPFIQLDSTQCSGDLLFYSVYVTSDADALSATNGSIIDLGNQRFIVADIPITENTGIEAIFTNTGCLQTASVSPPNCNCPNIPLPVSNGNDSICENEDIDSLSVVVGSGLTADWYDAPVNGNLLISGSTSYLPADAGSYYVETREPSTGCTSTSRIEITLIIDPLPGLSTDSIVCSSDLENYQIYFTTDATDITVNNGILSNTGSQQFRIDAIPIDSSVNILFAISSTGCGDLIQIDPPNCDCGDIPAPIASGNDTFCIGAAPDTLFASADNGLTVDWYDAASGGNVIIAGQSFLLPDSAGTFYAEARDSISGCTSNARTALFAVQADQPRLDLVGSPLCEPGDTTYTTFLVTDGDSVTNIGTGIVYQPINDTVVISGINLNDTLRLVSTDSSTGCSAQLTVNPPQCACIESVAPVSLGDVIICDDTIPPFVNLQVSIPPERADSVAVDWYDAPSGGNRLIEGSLILTVAEPGIYYAETRNIFTGCINPTRAPVAYRTGQTPEVHSFSTFCITADSTYEIVFSSDAVRVSSIYGTISGGPAPDNNWLITGIPDGLATTLRLTLADTFGVCDTIIAVSPPSCGCPPIDPPVILGDTSYCTGDGIPVLNVSPVNGFTVNWYDQVSGGVPVESGSFTFRPSGPDTFYAELIDTVLNCVSARTAVEVVEFPPPAFTILSIECQPNQAFYDVFFTSDANLFLVTFGTVEQISGDTFQVSNIPIDEPDIILYFDTLTTCANGASYFPPNCDCPDVTEPSVSDDINICASEPIPSITASNFDGTIYWYTEAVGGTPIFTDQATITPDAAGTYYAENRDTLTDCASDRVPVSISVLPNPSPPISNGDFTFCSGDIIAPVLTVDLPAGTYADWYDAETGGNLIASQSDGITPPAQTATFWVEAVDTLNGCTSTARTPVSVIEGQSPDVDAGGNTTNCQLQGILLGSASVDEVQWSSNDPGVDFGEPGNNMTSVNVQEPGVYTLVLTATDGVCDAVDSVEFRFSEVTAQISSTNADCGDSTATIIIDNVEGGIEPYEFDLNADFNAIIDEMPEVLQVDSAATYSVVVSDAFGCSVQEFVDISFGNPIVVDLGPDQNLFPGETALVPINVTGEPVSYTWSPNENIVCPDCDVAEITPENTTRYTLLVQDAAGCTGSDDIILRVQEVGTDVYIPNAFSPNNDGVNDFFTIYSDGNFNILSFEIYNRWGDRMYQRSNTDLLSLDGWNGDVLGKEAQEGVYVYTITVQFSNGLERSFKGDVHLIR